MKLQIKKLTVAVLTVILSLGMISVATAEEETSEVEVTVDDVVELDVKPDTVSYTSAGEISEDLSPGEQRETSDRGFNQIEVENIGSDRLDNIYTQATMHTEGPFGSTPNQDLDHNTGNFAVLSTETAQADSYRVATEGGLADVSEMHYLNRVEYFEDTAPQYVLTEDTSSTLDLSDDQTASDSTTVDDDISAVDIGRIRVGEASYFFVIYTLETEGDRWMLIGGAPETPTILGTNDFTNDGDQFTAHEVDEGEVGQSDVGVVTNQDFVTFDTQESSDYDGQRLIEDGDVVDDADPDGYTLDDINAEARTYNVYSDFNEDLVVRTKFNVVQESPEGVSYEERTSGAQEYILSASNDNEALQPGENFPVDFGVQVPNGVDSDQIFDGTVTFVAEAFSE